MRVDNKTCLIMDEVDGMSAGDRGGVGALNALIKKTKVRSLSRRESGTDEKIPMILICNDRTLQKMKPIHSTTFGMTFKRYGSNYSQADVQSSTAGGSIAYHVHPVQVRE
jgi:replication factor C subunit 1